MPSRRLFLTSLVPIAAAITLPKAADASPQPDEDLCQFHADGLAAAMKAKHGGVWSTKTDKENEFIIVSRVFS